MTPDLDQAIEQFDAAMGGSIHGYERADDMSVPDIVEALLAAGWRPPHLQDPCQFCGTPVQTDTEDDDSWPFEYPRQEGDRTVSYVHTPERCAEMRA